MTVLQPGRVHFEFANYADQPRWMSYWHQLNEIVSSGAKSCLVVGPGDGTVVHVLTAAGVDVTSLDVVAQLQPDLIADVRRLPLPDDAFDAILCCQVLEHIEYDELAPALGELSRVAKHTVVISLPDQGRTFDVTLRVSRRKFFRRLSIPGRKVHTYNGVHYWELGTSNTPSSEVRDRILCFFRIHKEFRVEENYYHHFFVLSPRT